jgi:hypothetical protein
LQKQWHSPIVGQTKDRNPSGKGDDIMLNSEYQNTASAMAIDLQGRRAEKGTSRKEDCGLDMPQTTGIKILSEAKFFEITNAKKDIESAFQERRKDFRINVNLTGGYIVTGSGERGLITLKDISYSGLKYKINARRDFYVNAIKIIKFTLDTYPLTVINREVIIRNVKGKIIGAEFRNQYEHDALPTYLRSKKGGVL